MENMILERLIKNEEIFTPRERKIISKNSELALKIYILGALDVYHT